MSDPGEIPYKILAKEGSYETLTFLDVHGKSILEELLGYMARSGFIRDEIEERVVELERIGFVARCPSKKELVPIYRLTSEGKEALSLVNVINGESLSSILGIMTVLRSSLFSLITHDITNYFIDDLACRRDFSDVYICSPWIRLLPVALNDFGHILESSRKLTKSTPRLHVITRPFSETLIGAPQQGWTKQIRDTLLWFKERGAEIVYTPNLHTKLFIIFGKGFQTAIFGSENLTGAKNIELGIRITDSVIVHKLYIYWEDIYNGAKHADFMEDDLVGK